MFQSVSTTKIPVRDPCSPAREDDLSSEEGEADWRGKWVLWEEKWRNERGVKWRYEGEGLSCWREKWVGCRRIRSVKPNKALCQDNHKWWDIGEHGLGPDNEKKPVKKDKWKKKKAREEGKAQDVEMSAQIQEVSKKRLENIETLRGCLEV